jgi:hypothetical protein
VQQLPTSCPYQPILRAIADRCCGRHLNDRRRTFASGIAMHGVDLHVTEKLLTTSAGRFPASRADGDFSLIEAWAEHSPGDRAVAGVRLGAILNDFKDAMVSEE